jgi:uncharacterized protein (DUF1501 family)
MMFNRRTFIASAAAASAFPSYGVRWARAEAPSPRALVIVFLRGGMDALNFIAPADDRDYAAARPEALRVKLAGEGRGLAVGGVEGSGDLVLNAKAKGLHQLFRAGKLAFIPAAGLNHGTRSHFQAMDLVERGLSKDGMNAPRDGWLTRAALAMGAREPGSILSISGSMPQSLSLCEAALPASDVWDIDWAPSGSFRDALLATYGGNGSLDLSTRQALAATQSLAVRLDRNEKQEPRLADLPKGISYPDNEFGNKLRFLAEMMRISSDIGVATVDLDGWDTHDNQHDRFGELVGTLSQSLQAFEQNLDAIGRPATIVVMSEFGRRVKANDNGGTDHGHGGVMMVLGNYVKGGANYGKWPGLATEVLDEGADLAVTTDFRDVLSTVLHSHGESNAIAAAFPGYTASIIRELMII